MTIDGAKNLQILQGFATFHFKTVAHYINYYTFRKFILEQKSSFEISVPKIWNHNLINCKLFSKLSGHPSVPSMIKQCFHDYFLLESILCILVFFSAFTFCVFRFFYPTKLHRTWWFIGLLELMSHNFFPVEGHRMPLILFLSYLNLWMHFSCLWKC